MSSRWVPLPSNHRRQGEREKFTGRCGGNLYFEELSIDARAKLRHPPKRPVDNLNAVTRVSDHCDFFSDDEDARPLPRASKYAGGRLFGRGMKQLHEQLRHAHVLYSEFRSNFDSDTTSIKPYAGTEIVDMLWVRKAEGGGKTRIDSRDIETAPQRYIEDFHNMKDQVMLALKVAVNVSFDDISRERPRSAIHLDMAKRLRSKVEAAIDQISDLLDQAAHTHHLCSVLIKELELLKDIIDPNGLDNMELFKSIADDRKNEEEVEGNAVEF